MSRTHALCLAALLAAGALVAAPATADLLCQYDIASNRGSTIEASDLATGVFASDLSAHGVDVLTGFEGTYVAAGWHSGNVRNKDRYYEFAVTAGDDTAIAYDSLTMGLLRGQRSKNKHGANKWELRASTDGFASSDIFICQESLEDTAADEIKILNEDLSILGTQTGTVTFRLYGYDYKDKNDYSGFGHVDGKYGVTGPGADLRIDGAVMGTGGGGVPEPVTATVLTLGGIGLVLRKKR